LTLENHLQTTAANSKASFVRANASDLAVTLALALSYDYVANQGYVPPAAEHRLPQRQRVLGRSHQDLLRHLTRQLAIFRSTEGLDFDARPKQSCFELRETIPLALQAYGYTIACAHTLNRKRYSTGGTLRMDYLVQRATHTGTGRSTEIIWPGGFATKNRESPHGEVVCSAKSRTVISKPHPIIEYPNDSTEYFIIPTIAAQCQGRATSMTTNKMVSGQNYNSMCGASTGPVNKVAQPNLQQH